MALRRWAHDSRCYRARGLALEIQQQNWGLALMPYGRYYPDNLRHRVIGVGWPLALLWKRARMSTARVTSRSRQRE